MAINHYMHDLLGRGVDGWYWLLLEESFEDLPADTVLAGTNVRPRSPIDWPKPPTTYRLSSCRNSRTCGTSCLIIQMTRHRRN